MFYFRKMPSSFLGFFFWTISFAFRSKTYLAQENRQKNNFVYLRILYSILKWKNKSNVLEQSTGIMGKLHLNIHIHHPPYYAHIMDIPTFPFQQKCYRTEWETNMFWIRIQMSFSSIFLVYLHTSVLVQNINNSLRY